MALSERTRTPILLSALKKPGAEPRALLREYVDYPPEGHSPSRAVISAAYTQGWPERSAELGFFGDDDGGEGS